MTLQKNTDIDKQKAAITIQSFFRSTSTRIKYGLNNLKKQELTDYDTFVVGNDPVMPKDLDKYHQSISKIALIGTSGLRSISLACKLGNIKNIPKIIIIDNSHKVYDFWFLIRELMLNNNKSKNKEIFFENLPIFLNENKSLYLNLEPTILLKYKKGSYLNQDISVYFNALFNKYGYDYVRAVICHTSLIKQSWEDKIIFNKVKNILAYLDIEKIYMYPSNIMSMDSNKEFKNSIISNINKISPIVTIHTDCCEVHRVPERVFLIEGENTIENTFFQSNGCIPTKHNKLDKSDMMLEALILALDSEDSEDSEDFSNSCTIS